MTNWEYLTQKENIKELAENLIQSVCEPIYDYNYDDELEHMYDDDYYATSDGERFDIYELEEAIEHEIKWLNSEKKNCSNCKNNVEFPPPHTCDICTSLDEKNY